MKTKSLPGITVLLALATLALLASLQPQPVSAESGAEYWEGYRMPDNDWMKANLSPHTWYEEGSWVPYQLIITKASKVWYVKTKEGEFGFTKGSSADIGWNFWSGAAWDSVYVDMLGAFYYKFDTSALPDGDPGSTNPFQLGFDTATHPGWTAFNPALLNRPGVVNSATGLYDEVPETCATPEHDHFIRLTPGVNGFPAPGDFTGHSSIVIYFQAHLSLTMLWINGQEAKLSKFLPGLAGTLYLGPDGLYGTADDWTCHHYGSSHYQGAASHFFLQFKGIGAMTIPIPIAVYPQGVIQGHKYVDVNGNGVYEPPSDYPYAYGWGIDLTATIPVGGASITFPLEHKVTDANGFYQYTGLVAGTYAVDEEEKDGWFHSGYYTNGTSPSWDSINGIVTIGFKTGQTVVVDFLNTYYQDIKVSKDATPSWKKTLTWTVEKTATPALSQIFVNDLQDVYYTVTVTATTKEDVFKVSGTITIDNPNPVIVVVKATILDEVWDGAILKGSQNVLPSPTVIPPGVSTYSYSITLSLPVDVSHTFTNKVTVTVTQPVSRTYTFTKDFSYASPTELVDDNVDVTDSLQGFLGTVNYKDSPKTFTYTRKYGPYATVGTYTIDNTATAKGDDTGTEWKGSASVKIEVYDISVSKTVVTYWERTFGWTITKSVEAAQLNPFINDLIEVKYTINVAKWVDEDFFKISGTITIVNNNPFKSAEVYVIDKIYYDMTEVASLDLGPFTIAPGASKNIDYEIIFKAEIGKTYTNKAIVDLNNYHWDYLGGAIDGIIGTTEFIGTKDFAYTVPDKKINDSVVVTDVETFPDGLSLVWTDYTGGWTTYDTATFYVNKIVKAVKLETWILKDEAFAKGDTMTWSSGEKTLTFNVYDISVSKTAETWWKRSFDWTIEKSASPTELILFKGGSGTVTYTVTITKTLVGNVYKVFGTITIVNNNPEKSAVVHVVDKIHAPDGSVVDFQDFGTKTIAPLGTLTLDYEIFFTPTIGVEYKNVAHVDLENNLWKLGNTHSWLYNTEFTGLAAFTFTKPTTLEDDTATVTEEETVPPEFSATVNWGTAGPPPWTVTDSTTITFTKTITAVSATPCVWYNLPDTVKLTESDTGVVHEASALVKLHVPISHTVGYWRNHPEAWVVIKPGDKFPWTTGAVADYTYMQILQTSPGGDASIILAQQYIAAKLNSYAFGVPSSIAVDIAAAEAYFAGTPASPFWPKAFPAGSNPQNDIINNILYRTYATNLASILEAYNKSGE